MPKDAYDIRPLNVLDLPQVNNRLITLNEALRTIFLRLSQTGGGDGGKPVLKTNLDLGGNDLVGVGKIVLKRPVLGGLIARPDTTLDHSVATPANSPVDADALRDDLVNTTLPSIEEALDDIQDQLKLILETLRRSGLLSI